MTEQEARQKWCPMSQIATDGQVLGTNRGHIVSNGGDPNLKCIASDCMAWREIRTETWNENSEISSTRLSEPLVTITFEGYCGLAGKPC